MQNANFKTIRLSATPTLTTSETAAGDVLCATVALTPALPTYFIGEVVGITILDKDDQGSALDVVLLKSAVELGTPNAAVSISDANAEEILRVINVPADGYTDLIGCRLADVDLGKPLQAPDQLYLGLIDRTGSKTFTAAGLVVTLWLRADDPR